MALWKIILRGETAFDVQGVNLRETIDRIAKKSGTAGFAKNEKGRNVVEVICRFATVEEAEKFRQELYRHIPRINPLAEIERIKIEEPKPFNDPAILEADMAEFTIKRDEDMTEMVWALQNAGYALLKQDELRNRARIRALKAELFAFLVVIEKLENKNPHKERFTTITIENILREPPSKFSDIAMAKLHNLYSYAQAVNGMIKIGADRSGMPLDEVRMLIDEIRRELDLNG
jgi:acylphosphatase